MFFFQNITLLSMFNEPCDDIGECYRVDELSDFRADNRLPYQCASYSFCPDPCCPLRRAAVPEDCLDVNPCGHDEAVTEKSVRILTLYQTRLSPDSGSGNNNPNLTKNKKINVCLRGFISRFSTTFYVAPGSFGYGMMCTDFDELSWTFSLVYPYEYKHMCRKFDILPCSDQISEYEVRQ